MHVEGLIVCTAQLSQHLNQPLGPVDDGVLIKAHSISILHLLAVCCHERPAVHKGGLAVCACVFRQQCSMWAGPECVSGSTETRSLHDCIVAAVACTL